MGWVRDDHVRLGQILHHSPSGSFLHLLTDTPLDLRITFLLLVLFLDLLLGHSHVFAEFVLLVDKIRSRNDHIDQRHPDSQICHRSADQCNSLHQIHIIQGKQQRPFIFQIIITYVSDQSNLQNGLDQFHQRIGRKNSFEARKRVQFTELGL